MTIRFTCGLVLLAASGVMASIHWNPSAGPAKPRGDASIGSAATERPVDALVDCIQRRFQNLDGFGLFVELCKTLAEELEHLGELRGDFQRAAELLRGLLELPVVHEELTEAEARQIVVRVLLGHVAEPRDLIGQAVHVGVRAGRGAHCFLL